MSKVANSVDKSYLKITLHNVEKHFVEKSRVTNLANPFQCTGICD